MGVELRQSRRARRAEQQVRELEAQLAQLQAANAQLAAPPAGVVTQTHSLAENGTIPNV